MDFEGKVAIVTGAGQGIGKEIATKLAQQGANVALVDLNPETANDVAREIKELGRKAIAIKADVSSSTQVNQMVEQVLSNFGTIDILVNNAGFVSSQPAPFTQETEEYWDKVIAVCLKGVILCSRAVLDAMMAKKGGNIVNIGSDAGRVGQPGQAVYSGAKGGVIAFTKALAKEVARYAIRVNCVSPGATNTPAFQQAPPEVREGAIKACPLRKVAEPEDIANAVMFLCSSKANHVTGQVLSVSGGYTMVD